MDKCCFLYIIRFSQMTFKIEAFDKLEKAPSRRWYYLDRKQNPQKVVHKKRMLFTPDSYSFLFLYAWWVIQSLLFLIFQFWWAICIFFCNFYGNCHSFLETKISKRVSSRAFWLTQWVGESILSEYEGSRFESHCELGWALGPNFVRLLVTFGSNRQRKEWSKLSE